MNRDAAPPPEPEASEGPLHLPHIPVPRMPKLNLFSTLILLVLTVLAIAFFPMVLNLERYRHEVEERASLTLGFPVRMKHLSLDFTRGLGVRAQTISILSADGRRTLLRVGAVTVAFDVADLMNRKFTPRSLRVDAPYFTVEHRGGHWYLEGLETPLDGDETPRDIDAINRTVEKILHELTFRTIEITGGVARLSLTDGKRPARYSFRRIEIGLLDPVAGMPMTMSLSASLYLSNSHVGDVETKVTTVLPASGLDLRTLPLNVETAIRSLDIPSIGAVRNAGIDSGRGDITLSAGGRWNDVKGSVSLDLHEVAGDMPYVFKDRFRPGEVGGKFGFAWDGRFLKAESFAFQIGPTDLTYLRWLSDSQPPDPNSIQDLEVEFHIRDVDLDAEWNHIPWPLMGGKVADYCNSHIKHQGHATYYRNFLPLRLTRSLDGSVEAWLDFDRFWIDTEVKDLDMFVLPQDRLRYSGINGRFYISKANFIFDHLRGRVDDALDVDVTGRFDQIDRQAKLHLDITGEFPYPALLNILPNYGFRAVQKVVAPLSGGKGTLSGSAAVDYDITADIYSYGGELRLSDGSLQMANYPVALAGLSGPIKFTQDSLDLGPITGKFGTGDLSIRMNVSDPNGATPEFELRVGGDDLALEQVLPSTSRIKGRGIVSGNYSTSGRMGGTGAQLKRTAFFKSKGVEIRTPEIRLPVRDLDCTLKYATGERSSFSCGISYGESIAKISAGFADTPQGPRGDFTIDAPNANLDDLMAAFTGAREGVNASRPQKPAEISIVEPPLPDLEDSWRRGRFTGIVKVDQGVFQRTPFEELNTQAVTGGGAFTFNTLMFAGPGGRYDFDTLTIGAEDRNGGRRIRMAPKLDGVWLKPMLEALGNPTDLIDGTMSVRGVLEFVASGKNDFCRTADGNLILQFENGKISKDYRAFAQVASLVNLRLSAYPQGIPFKTLRADVGIGNGVATGRGFVLDTADFDIKADAVEIKLCDKWVKTNATVSVFRREFFSRLPVDLNKILRVPVSIDQSYADKGD